MQKSNRFWLLILAGIAALALISFFALRLLIQDGLEVELIQDGQVIEKLSLQQDTSRRVARAGGGYNLVRIKDGAVFIEEASCPDHICLQYVPQRASGEPIVCLPNRLVVKVIGGAPSELDGVVQ